MPAKSQSQRALFAIAEHHPDELYAKNKSLASLPHQTLHDFAATPSKELPKWVKMSSLMKTKKKRGK